MKHSIYVFAIVLFVTSCANVGSISGGEKDTLPPEIKKEYPPNFHINSTTNQIILTFDEYLATTNLRGEITITPEPKTRPKYVLKGKNIILQFEEPLEENTTYVINFGKGIADLNENNVLEGYLYVFSTGDHIDSNFITGSVLDIVSEQPIQGSLIGLYSSRNIHGDSAIYFRPEYYTKSDSNGNFTILYLPEDSFKIIAFTDKNNDFKIQQESEMAGIYSGRKSSTDSTPVTIYVSPQEASPKPIMARIRNPYSCFITYQVPLHTYNATILSENNQIKHIHRTSKRDTLVLFFEDEIKDSVLISISTSFSQDSARLIRRQIAEERLTVERSGRSDISKHDTIFFTSNYPISSIEKDNILVMEYDSSIVHDFEIKLDDPMELKLNFEKKPKTKYTVIFMPKSLFYNNIVWNTDTLIFNANVKEIDDFGEVLLELNIDTMAENLYLIFESKSSKYRQEISITKKVTNLKISDLTPGQYSMYLYQDDNQNRWWDKGDVFNRRSPEVKIEYQEDISLRANWELDLQWNVSLRDAMRRFGN